MRGRGPHYTEVAKEEMRAQLYAFLHKARREVPGAMNPLRSHQFQGRERTGGDCGRGPTSLCYPPAGMARHCTHPPAEELIACTNGLLHFPKRALLAHTPAFFTLNALPFGYNPAAPDLPSGLPSSTSFGPKIGAIDTSAGDIRPAADRRHAAPESRFCWSGPKRSGKGTIARILRKLLGQANVCGPTLSSLGTNFGLAPLIGKRLAIISDARIGSKTDQNIIVERILAITGEDALTIDRKYRDAWTGQT